MVITPISLLGFIGTGIWIWLSENPNLLPSANSQYGRRLLRSYLTTTHDILIISLTITTIILATYITANKSNELNGKRRYRHWLLRIMQAGKSNPWATLLFASCTLALINGTTYLYKDLISWYPELINNELLNNFSIRSSFITETMRRTDFRFIPLAHQDLHVLSWFTVQIKSWMLINAIELFAASLLIQRFTKELIQEAKPKKMSIFLIIFTLLASHPSTITAFTHVIFSERILTLIFAGYIVAYQHHQKNKNLSSFYLTFLLALIGIYIKDTAIILFTMPPLLIIFTGNLGLLEGYPKKKLPNASSWASAYKLEIWLCSLIAIFATSYIILSLIPSSFSGSRAYSEGGNILQYTGDIRLNIFLAICATRLALIGRKKIQACFLDILNITALNYCLALALAFKFDADSYLALPVQLIIVINITWALLTLARLIRAIGTRPATMRFVIFAAIVLLLTAENSINNKSALAAYNEVKLEQDSNQKTYSQLKKEIKKIRQNGNDVNIIINRNAAVSRENFLGQLNYNRLIEYHPGFNQYIIKDGANRGSKNYEPLPGDIAVNIDKTVNDLNPILKERGFEEIYRHNSTENSGLIVRITHKEKTESRQ